MEFAACFIGFLFYAQSEGKQIEAIVVLIMVAYVKMICIHVRIRKLRIGCNQRNHTRAQIYSNVSMRPPFFAGDGDWVVGVLTVQIGIEWFFIHRSWTSNFP
jgi:hypothetical protein